MNLTRSLLSTITQYICTLYLVFALFSLSLLSVLVSLYWDTCDAWSADLFQLASLSLDLVYALYDYVQPVLTTTAHIVGKVIDVAATWFGLFTWLFMRLLITVFLYVAITFVLCWNPLSWSTKTISCIWSAVRFCSLALFAWFCFKLGYWLMGQLMLDGRLETVSWYLVQLSSINLTCWFDLESYCPYDAGQVCDSLSTDSSSAALSVTPALAISNSTDQAVQPQLSGQLGAYLAGLTESDGSISVPQLDSNNTPTVKITFHIDDKPLAKELKSLLGYGSIQPTSASTKAIDFVIRSQVGILDIINLLNGNMRTPKIEALHALIDWVNSSNWDAPLLTPKPLDTSPLDSNAWLAGFSEGDGSFHIRAGYSKGYRICTATYALTQSRIDPMQFVAWKPIMLAVATFLGANLEQKMQPTFDRTGWQPMWRVRNSSQWGGVIIDNYFKTYPMFGVKYMNYLDWSKARALIAAGAHRLVRGDEGFNRLRALKAGFNSKRTVFNWTHLNSESFYKR